MPEPVEIVVAPRVVRDDGSVPFAAPVAGVDPTVPGHLATANWTNLQIVGLYATALGTFQPADAQLTAIAGLVPAADQGIYWTSPTAAALYSLTAFGRSVGGAADAAAARSLLGVVIGTHVQAYDAELQALAGLVSAADRVPYFTGAGTAALATFTSFGRSLASAANATAARSTLGAAASGAVTASGLTASATDVMVGRSSAGAGPLQLIACTAAGRQLLALAPATAGAMAIYDGTSWTVLGPGDEGQVLTMVGGVPKWTDLP